MDEGPTAIKNHSPEVIRNVDRVQVSRAEGCYKEDKLQVRHAWILDIERLHNAAIIDRDRD